MDLRSPHLWSTVDQTAVFIPNLMYSEWLNKGFSLFVFVNLKVTLKLTFADLSLSM
jgi:hypothetical protein